MHDRTTSTELIHKYTNVSAYIIRIYLKVRKLANKTDKSSIRLEKPMDIKLLSIFQFNHTNTNMFTKLNVHFRPPPLTQFLLRSHVGPSRLQHVPHLQATLPSLFIYHIHACKRNQTAPRTNSGTVTQEQQQEDAASY